MNHIFPVDTFLSFFPEFANDTEYKRGVVQNAGQRAMMHIGPSACGMPIDSCKREYALFLMTGHILTLDKMSDDGGGDGSSIAGTPYKATIGTVTVETTRQNTFTTEDWGFWLNQTKYGRELLALFDANCPAIYLNDENDSVRDLL